MTDYDFILQDRIAKTGLIYIIKNTINDKVYIGQTTTNIRTRFCQHCKKSTIKNRHYKIYNAIKKYGKDKFYIEELESNIPIEELDQKEIEYIEKYNSFKNGYNSTKGGDGRTINKSYDETLIIQMYKNGFSQSEIADVFKVSNATISRTLKKLNIETRHDGNKYETINTNDFISMWKSRNITRKEMAKHFKVAPETIKRHAIRLKLGRKAV